ncbi:Aste57867_1738 [Aphanomyces stellatus]|uniref:Aste57867_1738 protein n=1 Tax=Aphanomyces stellatus TaxID=120398 RepID=A0A485K604_9STRA|nr:hypothetical protein As57867_001736 [Aphanomyces stellatus]VFT78948.1 Aste57867_1738 [Aphanomyces stellatus]
MDALASKNAKVVVEVQDQPRKIYPYGADAKPLEMKRRAKFGTVTLDTTCGPLTLRGLQAWIDDTSPSTDLIVSRPVMEVLGYSIDDLLDGARCQQADWDVSAGVDNPATGMSRVQRLMAEERDSREPELADTDGMKCATPDVEIPPPSDQVEERRREKRDKVFGILMAKAMRPRRMHVDVFREDLGDDPSVKVEPLKVRIKPNSTPVKSGMRRHPPAHVEYMREHVAALQANGMVYLNNRSTWAAAPRIVPKKEAGSLRMTIDSRPINACTDPMPWPMPNLDSAMAYLVGTSVYFTLDWTKGYWQLPLHPESQEFFSFMTPFGVYTPTRVLMGQTDAVAYCQSVVHQLFGDLLFRGLLAWLDDLLGSATTVASLFDLLDQVLTTCQSFGLKLNPTKCDFFLKEAEWCGKIISAAGVTHSPRRIQGLVDLSAPTTAADLQQFVCATNWMRASIPDYNNSKKTALARVALAAIGWSDDHDKCFDDVKHALMHVVPLSHPRDDMEVCVFTDASDRF